MTNNDNIHFNKDDYDRLMKTIDADRSELEAKFLHPGGGLMLDDTLKTFVKPGNYGWPAVGIIQDNATDFGDSVSGDLGQLKTDWIADIKSLKGVSDFFTDTNGQAADLAKTNAEDFRDQYPDFFDSGSGPSTGSGSSGGQN